MKDSSSEEKRVGGMLNEAKKYTVGGFSGAAIIYIALQFQDRGIRSVMEQLNHQEKRLDKVESNYEKLDTKMNNGFSGINLKIDGMVKNINSTMSSEVSKLTEIIRITSSDRFTKSEHINFRNRIGTINQNIRQEISETKVQCQKYTDGQLRSIEEQIKFLQSQILGIARTKPKGG